MSEKEFSDDPTILDDANLWRRIHKTQLTHDNNKGGVRPSSSAFSNHRNGSPMSVALEEVFLEFRADPIEYLSGHDAVAIVSFTAGFARECKQCVIKKPLPEEPAHAEIVGDKPKRIQRKFAKSELCWVINPPKDIIEEITNNSGK